MPISINNFSTRARIGGEDPTVEEDWNKINYLMNQWAAGTYSGATWVDIQQVIWFYGDDGYAINIQHPHGTESKINWIIDHVNDNAPDPEQCEGPEYAIIGVARAENKQKVFFMIPEIPLGTLDAGLTMLSAFMAKRKRTKTQ